MTQHALPICKNCKHFISGTPTPVCFAFDRIPDDIYYQSGSHSKVRKGQRMDLTYEEK